jgi:hypothetical protein
MFLNLAERDPAILLFSLYEALRDGSETIRLELLGPGIMLHHTALQSALPPHCELSRIRRCCSGWRVVCQSSEG